MRTSSSCGPMNFPVSVDGGKLNAILVVGRRHLVKDALRQEFDGHTVL